MQDALGRGLKRNPALKRGRGSLDYAYTREFRAERKSEFPDPSREGIAGSLPSVLENGKLPNPGRPVRFLALRLRTSDDTFQGIIPSWLYGRNRDRLSPL